MEDLKRELEILESIDSTPLPPSPAPLSFIEKDGTLKIPIVIQKYLDECNAEYELDKNGRIHQREYSKLIKRYKIPTFFGATGMTFKEAPEAQVELRP